LEKLRGQPLPSGGHEYQDCASISLPPEGVNDNVEVFVSGSVTSYASVEDACKALLAMKPPPRHLIMDTSKDPLSEYLGTPLLGASDAATLEKYGFHYVVDSRFFAAHGLPEKPKRVIFFASGDATGGEAANKVMFGNQSVRAIPGLIAKLKVALGDDFVNCVTDVDQLDHALLASESDGALPWIIGHNEDGRFVFANKRAIPVDLLHSKGVVLSCSLYSSKSSDVAMRTTADLDLQGAINALVEALIGNTKADNVLSMPANSAGSRTVSAHVVHAPSKAAEKVRSTVKSVPHKTIPSSPGPVVKTAKGSMAHSAVVETSHRQKGNNGEILPRKRTVHLAAAAGPPRGPRGPGDPGGPRGPVGPEDDRGFLAVLWDGYGNDQKQRQKIGKGVWVITSGGLIYAVYGTGHTANPAASPSPSPQGAG
jgi:hypothetical protein